MSLNSRMEGGSRSERSASEDTDYESLIQRLHIGEVAGSRLGGRSDLRRPQDSHLHEEETYQTAIPQQRPQQKTAHISQSLLSTIHSRSPENFCRNGGSNQSTANSQYSTEGPLYENIAFSPQATTGAGGHFSSLYKRDHGTHKAAQPQMPTANSSYKQKESRIGGSYTTPPGPKSGALNRYAHTPVVETVVSSSMPIYENMHIVSHSGQRAQPQASPATASIYQHQHIDVMSSPRRTGTISGIKESPNLFAETITTPTKSALKASSECTSPLAIQTLDLLASPIHKRSTSNSSYKASNVGALATTVSNESRLSVSTTPSHQLCTEIYGGYEKLNTSVGLSSLAHGALVEGRNDYQLNQHTPIRNINPVRIPF